jgi:dipeptidyl aminopeptidase/acylaminoacyl peptidase
MSLSPGGRFLVWFMEDHWHLFDAETGVTRNLTEGLDVAFFDVDHDYPSPRGGHGVGGWVEGDRAVLIHDKFDVWRFPTSGGTPVNLTQGKGRERELVLRILAVDPEVEAFGPNARLHLASFDWKDKSFGYFATRASDGGLEPLLDEEKRFRVLAKAENADRLLYVREDYDEFPDLWVANLWFGDRSRVTDVNPGLLDRFAWGTSRLVEWTSDDGIPLQGVAILPGNYREGERYPVLTYFYRFFSQRLHEFNQPVINHRPSFPIYASDGYIVFLPDVRFEVGRPGISSLKSVVPGVKRLVELGLADPDALGLHGHSWSGYTTSYIVTQTNIFAAAVAGAPVSNMTSAYGGIRWGTGLARQFQYEQTQSRLSGSLWEARSDYIENSPLFYTDRIETPLVIMHGDEDEAVPWYQSIEFYLALRRTGKEAVFLQYRGEPHHPRKYANKLDYSLKMKAFFDHHLKGAPPPDWWARGVPHAGR